MPYKYIGRTIDHKGKTIWEIVGNLKNFGVGRMIVRNSFERYPEKSYMRILKVEALPNPAKPSMDERRKVKVYIDEVFRGNKCPEHSMINLASYKADYKLIPKDEEANYIDNKALATRIVPRTVELPPLLKELVIRENLANGDPAEKDNEVEVAYVQGPYARYRIAKEGEKPDFEITMGLGTPASPSLYEGIGLDFSK
ncbi:28S ribosomal protein S34, mitochondrial [Coccinella septempunctata]|uniref:28S ribosomal protein S34, mitochondrial n=1 Tax=Coccinella septempunctata TaxID=41139 RepID=UPI001D06FCCD|nr:28S ribosomal protein S34, mitochondrial [Coccinella septempunctata]